MLNDPATKGLDHLSLSLKFEYQIDIPQRIKSIQINYVTKFDERKKKKQEDTSTERQTIT